MELFSDLIGKYTWNEVKSAIYSKTAKEVEAALSKPKRDLQDFMALISPAAADYLEEMAQLSHAITRKRFGKTMQLYAPMYLSNECQNICTYCGFSLENGIRRVTLSDQQIIKEAEFLSSAGYQHILLVTGEANRTVGMPYFENALRLLKPYFSHISIEVQPLEEEEYKILTEKGLNTVLVYQETYHQDNYRKHHPKGKKSNYEYRLNTPDRLGKSGVHKIGLGVLLGLEDWRVDSFFCALHLGYLEKKYWQTKYSVSFPRLRKCEGHEDIHSDMSDKELVQLIAAYRILNEELELSISTREKRNFRNHVVNLGVTSMSAGSKTNPGGYTQLDDSLEQFEISDDRSVAEIVEMLHSKGIEPVWKDWDRVYW
ncbi:MAG: 2-iminoacetate synthase ThiH [Bacteroidia bacterium]|nr:2-iminoacetate synthase ThiH [Bacteroidia bacterium]